MPNIVRFLDPLASISQSTLVVMWTRMIFGSCARKLIEYRYRLKLSFFTSQAQGRDPVWGLSHTFQHKTPLGRPLIRLRRGPWVERPKPFPQREREIYRLCFFYTCSSFPRRCEGPLLSWAVNITTNANLFHDVPISPPIMFYSDQKLPRLVLVKASQGYWIKHYSSFSSKQKLRNIN